MPKLSRRSFTGALMAVPALAQSGGSAKFPETPGLTRSVAEFIVKASYKDLPEDVLELGKKSILDSAGLALCGSVSDALQMARKYIAAQGVSRGDATVIGTAIKVPARFAAFLNGIAIHAEDYDDTQLAVASNRTYGLLTHPSVTAFSSALATGEGSGLSGRDFMLAYHLGVEVQCKVSEAMAPRHYEQGFHSTGTCGSIGSAAAAAKVRKLDVERCLRGLSIAASSAAGLRENFGTMTKPLHAGRAAESGVVAVDLAALGWTATPQILEGARGFYRAAGGGYDPAAIVGKLGNPWTFHSPGISIKPHPSGSLTHPGMTEMRRLIQQNGIKADQVERVAVGTNSNMPTALIHHRPTTGLEAKFSMEFCMATLLLYGKGGLLEFNDEVVNRPEVKRMIERVQFSVHPEAEKAGYHKMTTIIDIHLKGGRVVSGRADFGKGSPQMPMSYQDVAEKFLDCAGYAKWPSSKAKALVEMVRTLEAEKDIRKFSALCAS